MVIAGPSKPRSFRRTQPKATKAAAKRRVVAHTQSISSDVIEISDDEDEDEDEDNGLREPVRKRLRRDVSLGGLRVVHSSDEGSLNVEVTKRPLPLSDVSNHSSEPSHSSSQAQSDELCKIDIQGCVSRVLEVISDVDPSHVLELANSRNEQGLLGPDEIVAYILNVLFESPDYPRDQSKAKHRKKGKQKEVDYYSLDRVRPVGLGYAECALNQLGCDFPFIPKAFVRRQFGYALGLYAPAHKILAQLEREGTHLYTAKKIRTPRLKKGKGVLDEEFERERQWLVEKLFKEGAPMNLPEPEEEALPENGIDCGCCFTPAAVEKMIQCPDGHLFCRDCMSTYSSTLLGEHNPKIVCMDQSGCKLPFSEIELSRFMSEKLLDLYQRVKQTKEIEEAGIEGLEECPFCDYKVIIDNLEEKLFHCEKDECGAVSCRKCKKLDHLPKSCNEHIDDKGLDARHVVEEAMSNALMRNCPKCSKPFIKESGCNKITCPHCRTLSCYICRQVISGYQHFDQTPMSATSTSKGKCRLWDPVEQRHHVEVANARQKAIEGVRFENPEVDEKAVAVELPAPPQPPPARPDGIAPDLLALRNMQAHHPPALPIVAPPRHIDLHFNRNIQEMRDLVQMGIQVGRAPPRHEREHQHQHQAPLPIAAPGPLQFHQMPIINPAPPAHIAHDIPPLVRDYQFIPVWPGIPHN